MSVSNALDAKFVVLGWHPLGIENSKEAVAQLAPKTEKNTCKNVSIVNVVYCLGLAADAADPGNNRAPDAMANCCHGGFWEAFGEAWEAFGEA